jgi:ACS family hexuronate transporter-like MFS transporter
MVFFGLFIGFVQLTHDNYLPVFLLAGSAYLIAMSVIHLLAPRLAVVAID